MPPIADDFTTPAPTIKPPPKKRTTTKKTKPIIGPVAPQISGYQSPTRVSTPAPSKATLPERRAPITLQSPVPEYTKVFQKNAFKNRKPIKPEVSITDLLSGFKPGAVTSQSVPEEEDTLTNLLSFRQADQAAGSGADIIDRREDLQAFLKKIRPENYDPEYGGPALPEEYKHIGNDINKPLKPHWDAKQIASTLSDYDEGSSFARFAMNDILKRQMRNQANWVQQQTVQRAMRVKDFLDDASSDAFEGDFNTLRERLEKNPDFLEFASYKDEYTRSPIDVVNEWRATKGQYGDEWVKKAMLSRSASERKHYEYVRDQYNLSRRIANQAIKRYEKKYNRSVEFAQDRGGKDAAKADAAGPAVPDTDKYADRLALDTAGFAEESTRSEAKKRLGVKDLPSVKEMLAVLVSQGQIDPDNDGELQAWITRLQNPNHPDTRALYVAFARNQNKKLDVEGDALDFINEPITQYMDSEKKRLTEEAKKKAAAAAKSEDIVANATPDIVGTLADPRNWFDTERRHEGIAEAIVESAGEVGTEEENTKVTKSLGAMFWTFDKLSRLNYGVAGATSVWNDLDQDSSDKATPWWAPGPLGFASAPFNLLQGKNLQDSIDEVWKDPSKLQGVAGEAYQQVFRGSNLPGIKKDTVPVTFSQVIANNAQWDSEDNLYDQEWYQHVSGFVLDVGTDPLNFVGVGVVATPMKVPVRVAKNISKGVADSAVTPARFVRELLTPNKSDLAEKSFRVNQVLARQGDTVRGDALITERGTTPIEFTVEYTNAGAFAPVGDASIASRYTNPRYFAETKSDSAQLTAEINELKVLAKNYPGQVALESYRKDLNKIVDDLDLGVDLSVPTVPVRRLMAENSIPIKTEGLGNLKLHVDNPGGVFWQRVLNPLEDATAKWPGHKSSTRFAEFTDEAGNTRLTTKAAAARRALDEEETYYRLGQTAPAEVQARWVKAIDEAESSKEMWQEYDVEHFLDEGAPGLIPPGGWSPSKAYAHAAGVSHETFLKFWSDADVVRSLKRGPEILKKQDAEYAQRVKQAAKKIKDSKEKLATTTNPTARAAAYRALSMGYRDMSQATLEGSFRYLEQVRSGGINKGLGETGARLEDVEWLDNVISQGGDELVNSYSEVDDISGYIGGAETTDRLAVEAGKEKPQYYDGTYSGIDPFEFSSFEEMLNSVDSAHFSSRSAQIQSLLDELNNFKRNLPKNNEQVIKVYDLSDAQVMELDRILPVKSQFRKQNGDFDTDKIKAALYHNKDDLAQDNTGIFKVSYKLSKPADSNDAVAMSRYSKEAKFLDVVAKRVEEKAEEFFRLEKSKVVESKTASKGSNEAVEDLQEQISKFWTKGKAGLEGPNVRKLGPKPTRSSIEAEFPNTFKQERSRSVEQRNAQRNEEILEVDVSVTNKPKPNKIAAWDAGRGMSTAAERRIQAVLKGKIRQWEKARRTAQENDAANLKKLKADLKKAKNEHKDFQLTLKEIEEVYRKSFNDARTNILDNVKDTKQLLAAGANSTLSIGDTAAAMAKQAINEIKYQELQLKIAKAEASLPEELAAIERQRKALIKKKIGLYDRVKKAKMEARAVRITMDHRVAEEHLIQAATMPTRVEGRVLQLHVMGMKKNLQFTSGLFKGAEFAEKYLPARIWAAYQDNWVRPSKQLKTQEAIEFRANWESKTPVVIYSQLKKLTHAMRNTTESERSAMLLAYRKGIPYGGPKQLEYQNTIGVLDEIMDIINGNHIAYQFKRSGKVEAEALGLHEILRFLPQQYAFNTKVLLRSASERPVGTKTSKVQPEGMYGSRPLRSDADEEAWIDIKDVFESNPSAYPFTQKQMEFMDKLGATPSRVDALEDSDEVSNYIDELKANRNNTKAEIPDPFSPAPTARSEFTFDDLMNAIESNGLATPKDLVDPFRVAWVYNLAAGQASQFRALTKSVGDTFGVSRPVDVQKAQIWNKLRTEHEWGSVKDIPDVLFPPESLKEVETLMKFAQPGPEQAKFVKMMDQAIGYWKQGMTIYNPAYYTRNGIGEVMVSWLDGVNHPKWYRMAGRVNKYVKNSDQDLAELISKYDVLEGKIPVDVAKGNEVLFSLKGGLKIRIEDVLKKYVDQGLMSTFVRIDIDKGVRGLANQSLESNPIRKGMAKTNQKVHEIGEGFEDYLRLAHFMHAMQHSGKGSIKEAASYAASRVRRSHFDYTDFSDMEKAVMLRAFPFYKWIRRGAPLMMQHLFLTPGKMAVAPKAMDTMSGLGFDPLNAFNEGPVFDTQDVYEDKNGHLPNYSGIAPAWIRDLFAYQMQPAADDEYANFFRLSLPQFDGLQGLLSFASGDIRDSTASTLLNPFIKAPLELGMNQRLDPDSNFEIYGGEFNEQMGISDREAIGAYIGQQANPLTSFLAKLSKNGKLPVGNISNGESGRDATRDVASYLTGLGFYQSKLGYEGEFPSASSPTAVGPYGSSDIPVVSGAPAASNSGVSKNDNLIKKLLETASGPGSSDSEGKKKSGWIPNKYGDKKKSGWIPNKYGKGSSGFSGGGSSDIWALLELLMRLKEETDQGRVIDPNVFRSE